MTLKVELDNLDENIMINRTTRQIKLIDFGSATRYQDNEVTTFYGTQKFACPESIQNKAYNLESQEVWALGTLLYVMLFKMDPFTSDYEILEMDLGKRISRLRRGLDTNAIVISDQVTELLVALTQKSSKNRPSLFNICNFAWLALE